MEIWREYLVHSRSRKASSDFKANCKQDRINIVQTRQNGRINCVNIKGAFRFVTHYATVRNITLNVDRV